jgi:hypothetical protein
MSPKQQNGYYVAQPGKISRIHQTMARSEEQLNKQPVMVEYMRPVGILTSTGSPPAGSGRPGSAQAQSRDNSQDSTSHVTRY